jgi:hypothetical protein
MPVVVVTAGANGAVTGTVEIEADGEIELVGAG